jgi:hypothetical protein
MEITTKEALAQLKQELINEMFGGGDCSPDLTKLQDISFYTFDSTTGYHNKSYTVPEDGWFFAAEPDATGGINYYLDDIAIPCVEEHVIALSTGQPKQLYYGAIAVRKGQVISVSSAAGYPANGQFAPCRGNVNKTN